MKRFNIGDYVWVAHFNPNQETHIPCTVCYGKRVVTLILGNGDQLELPCDYCGKGWDGPRGWETEYRAVIDPEQVRITSVSITVTDKGEEVQYHATPYSYRQDMVFATRDEALAKSEELAAIWIKDQNTRSEYIKKDTKKTFAWNAGYHMRQVRDYEKKIVHHKERAKLCEERSKKAEGEA